MASCVLQVWAWKENVWEKEKGTLLERYTVEQSKPSAEGGGVLSTLTINNVMESDFLSTYNCTAWNSFGPGTMIISLEETGALLLIYHFKFHLTGTECGGFIRTPKWIFSLENAPN